MTLYEAADSKQNLHLTHADEDIFERGDKGAQAAIDFAKDVVINLGKGSTKLTVKWDGAPALFAGWDPADGKFFVGTKSVFAKTPKVYKTPAEIDANEAGGKANKLKFALEHFPKVGIPKNTVLQGDLLFTKGDEYYETIDGKRWLCLHPNTIVYAWPAESDIAKEIRNAQIGVVWHTVYTGKGELANYSAKFGVDVSKLKKVRDVMQDDAFFKGVDIAFSDTEIKEVIGHIKKAQSLVGGFDSLINLFKTLPSAAAGAHAKTFYNSYIRKGRYPVASKAYDEYVDYLKEYWEKNIVDKVKTDAAKESKRAALKQFLSDLNKNKNIVQRAFQYVEHTMQAKMVIVRKLNELNKQKMFVRTKDGYKVTAPEGFVCINSTNGEAVKFVDRLTFSHFNFSTEYLKGWMR